MDEYILLQEGEFDLKRKICLWIINYLGRQTVYIYRPSSLLNTRLKLATFIIINHVML